MSQVVDTGYGTILLAATVEQYLRVKADGTIAGDEADIGTVTRRGDAGDNVALSFANKQGTSTMIANASISAGAEVFAAADGKVAPAGTNSIGTAWQTASGDGSQIEVQRA